MTFNRHSIGVRIGFWVGLVLILTGLAISAYAVPRMLDMAALQRRVALETARAFLVNAAKEQAAAVRAELEPALVAARTLAQASVSAVHKNAEDMTDADWSRLQKKFRRMEMAADLAESLIQARIDAVARGEMTPEEARRDAAETVRELRYDQGNYLWIHDLSEPFPVMIMHPINPSLEGQALDDPSYETALGRNENLFVALNAAVRDGDGSGYVHYRWPKPGTTEMAPKLSHGRLIPQWGWVVGSGMGIDNMAFYSRDDISQILRAVLTENPRFLSVFTAWEPNAFDARDQVFVGTPGSHDSGRFLTRWRRGGAGGIELEAPSNEAAPDAADYYARPKASGIEFLTNPRMRPSPAPPTSLATAPILLNGQFRGIMGVEVMLDGLQQLAEAASGQLYEGRAEVSIVANDGTLIGASAGAAELGRKLDGGNGTLPSGVAERDGRLVAQVPITLGATGTPWLLRLAVPLDIVTALADQAAAAAHRSAIVVMVVAALAVVLGIGVVWLMMSGIVRGLGRIATSMRAIAEGEGDLTRSLDVKGRDELAELAAAFNGFQRRLRELIAQLAAGGERLAAAAEQLSVTSEETNMQVRRQQSETSQVATAMNQMSATVAEVARSAAAAAQSAQQADTEADNGRAVVTATVEVIQSLARQLETSQETIDRLSNDSVEIGKVLDVIRAIADQTNLLALNAAIEAARAGEQGRGFAVVADEVRTLASRTQASTQEIQDMIERLRSGASTAVTAMEEARARVQKSVASAGAAGDSLQTIAASVASIRDMNDQIATVTKQQTAVAGEVDRNLTSSRQSIEAVAARASQIMDSAIALAQLAADQQSRLSRFKV